jgi:hypothetical protein
MSLHPFHTMRLEDREMFAYNARVAKQKAELARVLAQPETRSKCALSFYYDFMDPEMNAKALNRFAEFQDVIEYYSEPYELW